MHAPYLWIIALSVLVSRAIANSDEELSLPDELWDYLTGDDHEYDEDTDFDYGDYDYEDGQESVYVKRDKWKWGGNEIPYEFDNETEFDDEYHGRIVNAISYLNLKLEGCITFR